MASEWVENLDASNKVFLVFAVIGVVLFILTTVYGIIKKKRDMADFLHITGTITICFLFWLLSAPVDPVWLCVFMVVAGSCMGKYLFKNQPSFGQV